jgi:hypothetical protein
MKSKLESLLLGGLASVVLSIPLAARAVLPEPDNLLYGSITLDGSPVTAARTDVVIEARRTTNGPAIASYRMGADPLLGNFYSLRLSLESVAPVTNNNASQVGDSVFVTVLDGTGLRAQTGFLITERGAAQRIDFGVVVNDGDGDGLPDAWELYHFAGLGRNSNSPGANGQTTAQNYLAGTDPNDPNDTFRLYLTQSDSLKQVSFQARRAEGPGYEGLVRLYTLESKSNLLSPAWSGVSGVIAVPGSNQTVVYTTADNSGAAFFRGQLSLQLDVGQAATNDQDGDSLPDSWELLQFGDLSQTAGSRNANGQTALQNYVAGTTPADSNSVFKLQITRAGADQVVSFLAIQAQGVGYEGKQRFYALESSPSLAGPWQSVSGLSEIAGTNQTVIHQAPLQPGPAFYRGRVWLQP